MVKAINGTETIEQVFENYKASYNEETPLTAGQETALDELIKVMLINSETYQTAFDKAIALSRASEKSGFIAGFKMAVNLIMECAI